MERARFLAKLEKREDSSRLIEAQINEIRRLTGEFAELKEVTPVADLEEKPEAKRLKAPYDVIKGLPIDFKP